MSHLNYPVSEDMQAIIAPPGASSVTLTFSRFQTESGYDVLSVYACTSAVSCSTRPLLQRSGSRIPAPVTSSTGIMLLVWSSDDSITDLGWSATWTSTTASGAAGIADGGGRPVGGRPEGGGRQRSTLPVPPKARSTTGSPPQGQPTMRVASAAVTRRPAAARGFGNLHLTVRITRAAGGGGVAGATVSTTWNSTLPLPGWGKWSGTSSGTTDSDGAVVLSTPSYQLAPGQISLVTVSITGVVSGSFVHDPASDLAATDSSFSIYSTS